MMMKQKKISIERITLKNPPDHINPFLTHWTGSKKKSEAKAFDILSKIVENRELKFSPCRISYSNKEKWKVTNQMICFTDTPISQSYEHCIKYGKIGISFNKKKMNEYGANPVLYITKNRRSNQNYLEGILNQAVFQDNKQQILLSWYDSIGQPFNTRNKSQFAEREWRIIRILSYISIGSQESNRGNFSEYPFKGEVISKLNPKKKRSKVEFFLKFRKNLIENIIVPESYENAGIRLIEQNSLNCKLFVLK